MLSSVLLLSGLSADAQYLDSLNRSAGFFISPAVNNFFYPGGQKSYARLGFSAGMRFKNELTHGFFLETGLGITTLGGSGENTLNTYWDYINLYQVTNEELREYTQINISAPFMAGYRTQKGKVRFEGSLGFSYNIRFLQYEHWTRIYSNPVAEHSTQGNDLYPSFGTSFSAIAKAGISIPISQRASLDILPACRYSFMYFTGESANIGECIQTDIQKWSAGLDIGFTWKLKNKEYAVPTPQAKRSEANEPAYTNMYSEEPATEEKPIRTRAAYKKNFIYIEAGGAGMGLSHNYERTVFHKGVLSVNARAGFGILPERFSFPLGANITLGKYHKKFELGIGTTIENYTTQKEGYYKFQAHLVPSLAYRYESKGHFFLRFAVMSHYFFDDGKVLPGIGVSVGGCF